MAIYKGFRVQIVDGVSPSASVIADLGIIAYSIVNAIPGQSTWSGRGSPPGTSLIQALNTFTDEREQISTIVHFVEGDEDYYNAVANIFPILNRFDFSPYVGNWIRLLNDSGYYATSTAAIPSDGLVSFEGRDPSGNIIASSLLGFDVYIWSGGGGVSAFNIAASYNDNTILRIYYNFRVESYPSFGSPILSVLYESIRESQGTPTINFLNNVSQYVPPPTDPYTQGGESDTGGGTGNFDGTSVDVDFTSLPTLSAVDTGFISLYNPTLAQLQSLANYMWSDLFDLDTFKKLFGDPMQAILGLSIVPGPVQSSGSQVVKVGNISTGINMNKAASQYIDVDCGTLNVEEFWGAYLDYEPYTKAEIYLPYIGTHQIAVDDIMGKAIHIKYHIDILSGGCACEIKCGGSVLYTFIGSCAVSIPVTGSDWTNLLNGVLSAASAIGTMVATGGAAAPAAAGEIASAAVNSLKPNIEKSGSVSGSGGLMAGKVPVLILTRPRQALPASQNEFTGYPAFITRSLGAVSGYTEVHKIRLGGIPATDVELSEIERLLKGGVIL